MTEDELERLARAVDHVAGVARLGNGAATYGAGRKIEGVRRRDGVVEIRIVAKWGYRLDEVARGVREEAERFVRLPVDVVVEDVVTEAPAVTTGGRS